MKFHSRVLLPSLVGLLLLGGGGLVPCLCAQTESVGAANTHRIVKDISYLDKADASAYEIERCKVDLYLPEKKGFGTVVWFHGGGLKEFDKMADNVPKLAARLASEGVGVVTVNYRLSPQVTYPAYIQDGAAAIAWVFRHIGEYGGDASTVFVGGHSAGGYLALMLGMDPKYLKQQGVELAALAGVIPISGQVMTHYTVREERGIDKHTITADEAAPVYYIRKGLPPMLVLYADNDFPARAEENAYFVAMVRSAGNKDVTSYLAQDRNHGSIAKRLWEPGDPVFGTMLEWINAHTKRR